MKAIPQAVRQKDLRKYRGEPDRVVGALLMLMVVSVDTHVRKQMMFMCKTAHCLDFVFMRPLQMQHQMVYGHRERWKAPVWTLC
jgi:hypothetical protein